MSKQCIARVKELLSNSDVTAAKQDEIINQIKISQAEMQLGNVETINVDAVAKNVAEQLQLQKKLNKRNAIENEIKIRNYIDYVMNEFTDNPEEGLIALLVGSNRRVAGARASVDAQQIASTNQLIVGFNQKLKEANLEKLFRDADANTERRIARTMYEIGQNKAELTEKNPEIIKLAQIMEEYSDMVRTKLNDRGANISKIWGYIVRQAHDPFMVRDAAKRLGKDINTMTPDPTLKGDDINYNKNFTAWKEFVISKLDQERTFAGVDNINEFMQFVYNSLVRNQNMKTDGMHYGARATQDVAKSAKFKRVLHFKSADDWVDYNQIFGVGNLKESFFSGLQSAGRHIGIMDTLGTKPIENFDKIRNGVGQRLIKAGRSTQKIANEATFNKYLNVVDGSIYTVEDFALAKYSAMTRSVASMAKLGGATISAVSDIGLYATEMKYQGRSFLGGMFEALSSLARIKNKQQVKDIAEGLGFVADNAIYDLSGRNQIGDTLNKQWTNVQRTFFKLNLLSWWTNSLKEGAMLGMANYFAKQKNISFNDLSPQLRNLFDTYNINEVKWDVIRKTAMEKADDGREFINIGLLDKISDADVKRITGMQDMTARELQVAKDKFKASVSGMLLDRTTYAVIEPGAKTRGQLTQGWSAGTYMGEVLRFFGQFKAFPLDVLNKTIGRDLAYFKGANKDVARGIIGLSTTLVTSILLGYVAMTAKDLLKGRTPRQVNMKSFFDAFLQGGGLGLYGDVLFKESRTGGEILGSLAGPVPLTGLDLILAAQYGIRGEGGQAAKSAYKAVSNSIPFMNLFYIKTAFDYLIGYQIMEYMNPGGMRRLENRMKKDYDQEFIFGRP